MRKSLVSWTRDTLSLQRLVMWSHFSCSEISISHNLPACLVNQSDNQSINKKINHFLFVHNNNSQNSVANKLWNATRTSFVGFHDLDLRPPNCASPRHAKRRLVNTTTAQYVFELSDLVDDPDLWLQNGVWSYNIYAYSEHQIGT